MQSATSVKATLVAVPSFTSFSNYLKSFWMLMKTKTKQTPFPKIIFGNDFSQNHK